MTSPRSRLLAAAATLALASPAMAQGSGVPMLLEQAGFWRAQGQPARAVAALDRALAAQPSNPDALAAASLAQLELGHVAEAEGLLARLRQAAPDDARVARVEEALRGAAPRILPASTAPAASAPLTNATARDAGLRALEAGETARAAQSFEAALVRDPGDRTSLGGLGVARLRQGRPVEARDLLQRALTDTSEAASRWDAALDEAAFAVELPEARRQLALGATEAAEALLLRAARRDAAGRAEAEALLGEIALRRGEAAEAEARFRAANSRRPGLPAARDGLLESLRRQNRIAEADALARQPAGASRAEALRAEAARTEDPEAALPLLREALAAVPAGHPAAPWARLDLARHLARLGRNGEARALMEAGPPSAADALQAAALHAEEDGRLADAIRLMERVPDRLRGGDQARLLRSLRAQAEVAAALSRRPAERRAALLTLAARPDPSGEAAPRVARALARLGDREGAAEAARLALAADRTASGTLRLALGTALADARLDREAGDLLRPLAADPALAPARRRQLAALLGPAALPPVAVAASAPRPRPIEAEPRLYQNARDPRVAGGIALAVLRRDPRNAEARLGAIEAALVLRDLPSAEILVAEGRLLNASDPRVSLAEAQLARVTGDRLRARTALSLAADQRRAQIGPEASPYRRTMLAGQAQDQAGDGQGSSFVPLNDNPAGAAAGGVTPSQLRASDDPLLSEIGRQLAEVNQEGSGRVVPNFTFRVRSGDGGLERLREYGGGVEAATPLPNVGGELSARVQAVHIETGNLDPTLSNLRRFGSNAVVLPGFNGTASPAQQEALRPRDSSATGAALGIAYARNGATIDIGSTPLGFREQNILGGIELTPRLSESFQLRLRGERRSVTDSLLSWSGMRDPQSGLTFGGVVRNTFRAQLEYYAGRLGAYAGGGYSIINGRNVADNNRWEAGGGISYALLRTPERELTTGLDVAYFAYDKNLRNFTLGQGGYFSPQTYIGASIPLDYRERIGNWAYRVGGSIGVAHFREKAEAVYPGNGGLQALLESQAAGDPTVSAFYPSQRETSVTFGARGDIEYALTPTLRVGAAIRYDRAADFNETRGLVYARYRFDP